MFAAAFLIVSSVSLPSVSGEGVDIVLATSNPTISPGCIVNVEVRLSASVATQVSAADVIFQWDPSQLQLLQTTPGTAGWFVAGYLPDPDGINNDVHDGTALFTALASPASPVTVGPATSLARLTFQVNQSGALGVLATAGAFGVTRVLGTNPGLDLTGELPAPLSITAAEVPALEVVRVGVPANPDALRPGLTGGPAVGQVWDPYVDHQVFFPGAWIDVLGLAPGHSTFNLPSVFGTILVDPGQVVLWVARPAGMPFGLSVPPNCSFAGLKLSAQAFSHDGNLVLLTNGLDLTVGS